MIMRTALAALIALACAAPATGGPAMRSGDAYLKAEPDRWTLGTAAMERVITLSGGRLSAVALTAGAKGPNLTPGGDGVPVFAYTPGPGAERITSCHGPWRLLGSKQTKLAQGELQLDITVERDGLEVTRSWIVYPGSSVVREWTAFRNAGAAPCPVFDPSFLHVAVRPAPGTPPQLHWMTGGDNQPGSWVLKTEALDTAKPRTFDSYEAFPLPPSAQPLPGDGIDAKILLNDRQLWPESGWKYVASAQVREPFALEADLQAGDRLVFLVNMHGGIGFDTTAFDPTIAYADGETHTASKEFADQQGAAGWRYQYLEADRFVDLAYYPGPNQWRKKRDNATGTPFVGPDSQHPDVGQDAARVWTAPRAGRVRITGAVCNTGNQGPATAYGFRMGSTTYAPWAALQAPAGPGLFIGWDYIGHWTSAFAANPDGSAAAEYRLAGHRQTLAPGAAMATPRAFTGIYRDDLDSAGNECLQWQYRYLWDLTREPWFPAIRMLGYWMNGTGWGQSGVGWTGGKPDLESTMRKVFRVADLMRTCGADVYHRDWGWWDRAGDWNGPDFARTGAYLARHGMGQLIYAFLYTVDPESKVAKEHPDWVLGGSTLDMSRPEVVDFMVGQLDAFVAKWGDFEWRNDSTPTAPNGADDTPLNGQDAGLREVIRRFLAKHPKSAFQAVNGGGNNAGVDYARHASAVSFSDGAVGIIRNYWASLILPPDKTSDIPDIWNPDRYDPAIWRGLLCTNFDMTGDTWDPAKLEGLRQLIDIYHYLHRHGVVGRWVRVHRPAVEGDDPTMYFQRLSGDRKRGIIIPKRTAAGPVTIRPKGLLRTARYVVSFHESPDTRQRTGADLMERGIRIEKMAPGELVYLNLPLHPGSKRDTTPPTPPTAATKRPAEHMGYPGVEIAWKPGADDNWVSYHEVLRDGEPIGIAAHGAFLFDHSVGADPAAHYEVRTVDGAGNRSPLAPVAGPSTARATVIDDAPGGPIRYVGAWTHAADLQPAHAGTLSSSDEDGASAEVTVEGGEALWFTRLGPRCGLAAISIDGAAPEEVDTYSADDIWGVCAWRRLLSPGRHTLRITVLGRHARRSTGSAVHIDGLRITAPSPARH